VAAELSLSTADADAVVDLVWTQPEVERLPAGDHAVLERRATAAIARSIAARIAGGVAGGPVVAFHEYFR